MKVYAWGIMVQDSLALGPTSFKYQIKTCTKTHKVFFVLILGQISGERLHGPLVISPDCQKGIE